MAERIDTGSQASDTLSVSYELEYGTATVEMHADALDPGDRVLVVDDVLATGGTLDAARALVEQAGASVAGHVVAIELPVLGGRERLGDVPIRSLATF